MLTEERYATILKILEEKKAVTVIDLTNLLDTSESTIRRDLNALHKNGKLYKVYGGATAIDNKYTTREDDVRTKQDLHMQEKSRIGQTAAQMIKRNDFVYLDAGTTTESMLEHLAEKNATYVTNGISHATRLSALGFKVFIIGGQLKDATGADIGTEAMNNLRSYNFTKGFFGANGISIKAGFSTPDSSEGLGKGEALARCRKGYILADSSKFNKISPITFANIACATIITNTLKDRKYHDYTKIIEVTCEGSEEK